MVEIRINDLGILPSMKPSAIPNHHQQQQHQQQQQKSIIEFENWVIVKTYKS